MDDPFAPRAFSAASSRIPSNGVTAHRASTSSSPAPPLPPPSTAPIGARAPELSPPTPAPSPQPTARAYPSLEASSSSWRPKGDPLESTSPFFDPASLPAHSTPSARSHGASGAEHGPPSPLSESDLVSHLRAQVNALSRRAREQLLQDLLGDTAPIDLSPLYPLIVPRLQRDFLRTLPLELALHVLSFVDDAKTLARASAVSRHWHALLLDESTWRRMCWKSGFAPPEKPSPPPPVPLPADVVARFLPERTSTPISSSSAPVASSSAAANDATSPGARLGTAARLRTLEFGERARDWDDALFTPAGRERRGTLDREALEEIAARTGGYAAGFAGVPVFGSVFGSAPAGGSGVAASSSTAAAAALAAGLGTGAEAMDGEAGAGTTGLGFGVSVVEAEGAARASMAARRARGSVEAVATGLTSPGLVSITSGVHALDVDAASVSPMPESIQFGTIPPGPVRTPTGQGLLRATNANDDAEASTAAAGSSSHALAASAPQPQRPFSYRSHFKLAYLSEQNWVRGPGTLLSTQMSVDQGVVTSMAFDNEWIVVGMDTSKVHIFEAGLGTYVRTLAGHELGVWCLTLVSRGGGPRFDDELGFEDDDEFCARHGFDEGKGKQRARSREPGTPASHSFFRADSTPLAASSYSSPSSPSSARPPPRRRRRSSTSFEPSAGPSSSYPGARSGTRPTTCGGMGLGAGGPTGDSTQQGGICGTARGWGQPGAVVVSGGSDRNVRVWDVATGCVRALAASCRCAAASGGARAWLPLTLHALTLSHHARRRCLHVLPGHTSTVRCLRVLDARPVAVSGSRDGSIRVWDIQRGLALRLLSGHRKSVRAIEVCGNKIVSGSYDTTARVRLPFSSFLRHRPRRLSSRSRAHSLHLLQLWNVDTGECLHVFRGHIGEIYSVAFDGARVITGSLDSTVRVWDAETGCVSSPLYLLLLLGVIITLTRCLSCSSAATSSPSSRATRSSSARCSSTLTRTCSSRPARTAPSWSTRSRRTRRCTASRPTRRASRASSSTSASSSRAATTAGSSSGVRPRSPLFAISCSSSCRR